MELEQAANKRFFITEGYFSNAEIAEVARKDPELKNVAKAGTKGGDYPEGGRASLYKFDNSRSVEILGLKYRPFEEVCPVLHPCTACKLTHSQSIRDTINSLKPLQKQK